MVVQLLRDPVSLRRYRFERPRLARWRHVSVQQAVAR